MVIDWINKDIQISKTDMLLIQSTPVEIYQLDLTVLHETLRAIEDNEDGIVNPTTHTYKGPTSISGVILAQVIEILLPYTITFEDGNYNVNIVGGNSNISDRTNKNMVGVNTSNSAGLQDLTSLQAASFADGAIALWQGNGTDGTTYPIGTKGKPANSWADARSILMSRNMDTILVLGSATCSAGDDISNLIIRGTNPMLSSLIVLPDAVTQNAYLREIHFQGTLDGGSILRECVVGGIDYFNGYLEHCALTSTTININGVGILLNCMSGATCTSAPVLDLTNATGLSIRRYSGNLKLVNKHGPGLCQIEMNGWLEIDSSCDNGIIQVTGDCKITNNGTGTFVLIDDTTGSPEDVATAVSNTLFDSGKGAIIYQRSVGGFRKDYSNNHIIMLNADGTDGLTYACFDRYGNPSLTTIDRMEVVV